MKIGVLSFFPSKQEVNQEERRLLEAARQQGYQAEIIRADACQIVFGETSCELLHEGRALDCDVYIPRARVIERAELHLAAVKQLQLEGAKLVNGYQAIVRAKNKLRTIQLLSQSGIAHPESIALSSVAELPRAAEALGGFPLILKDPNGTYGRGVILVEGLQSAKATLQYMIGPFPRPVLLQEFIEESGGKDARLFMVGGKLIAAMQRQSKSGDFRSNIELGGVGEAYAPSQQEIELAQAAVKCLDLDVAGVDIIQSKSGPMVLEVNANPGFKALEACTGVDVAGAIIEFCASR